MKEMEVEISRDSKDTHFFKTFILIDLFASMWDLQSSLWHGNSWLQPMGSNSLTRDQTQTSCTWGRGILATGPPGKSLHYFIWANFLWTPLLRYVNLSADKEIL